ncbi:MAG: hypothetical protein ACFFAO_09035 [Candidatus Hermodarchaeota archaeon]
MVSQLVLLEGFITIGGYFFGVILCLYAIYKSTKTDAQLLLYTGITIVFLSHLYFATLLDFTFIISTGQNMDNSYGQHAILTYLWLAPIVVLGMYIAIELIIPKKKWFILPIYIALSIIFEIYLFLDPINSFETTYTDQNIGLIHSSVAFGTPLYIILGFFFISALIFYGIGFFIMAFQSSGILRKKFILLSISFITFFVLGAIDVLTSPGIVTLLLRAGEMSCSLMFYLGIKEQPVKTEVEVPDKKEPIEKTEVSLVETLSYSRPDDLSEEELKNSREQSLCMVCKKSLVGFNTIFICVNCNTYYCQECAQKLIELDNICWGCMELLDISTKAEDMEKKKSLFEEMQAIEEVYRLKNKNQRRVKRKK